VPLHFPMQLPVMMFRIVVLINLRLMTATGIMPGVVMNALTFAAAEAVAAGIFVGEEVGICAIIALLGESYV
jgi:hypothetical protein